MSKEQKFLEEIRRVRQRSPRIHCLTNPVTMQDVANLLLTAGGSAIMAQDSHEVGCVVSVSVRAFGAVYRMLHCAEFE